MQWFARAFDRFESYLSILIAGTVAFAIVIIGVCILLNGISGWEKLRDKDVVLLALTLVGTAIFGTLEVFVFNYIDAGLKEGYHPLAPNLAIHQGRWHSLLRPFVAGFWFLHWASAIALMWGVQKLIATSSPGADPTPKQYAFFILCAFGISYAGNLYLLMGISSLGGKPGLINGIWRYRFAIDLTLVAMTAIAVR